MTTTTEETWIGASNQIRASVIVPMRNRENFIATLLNSLFTQWRSDLELILIDDASEDATLARATSVLEQHPEVDAVVLRVGQTQGVRLISILQSIARGQIFIQADSDDIAFPDRIGQLLKCFDETKDCRLVTSNAVMVSPEGLYWGILHNERPDAVLRDISKLGLAEWGPWSLRGLGATMAYHRHVFDLFPVIDAELCPHALDLVIPLRAALIGSHHYLAQPLVGWRQHRFNTHRLAGAKASDPSTRERYTAFELMALAQNIRDLESLRASRPAGSLERLIGEVREQFSTDFDAWCRVRTRSMQNDGSDREITHEAGHVWTVPPIVSMRAGDVLLFSSSDARSRLVACTPGFHGPEDWGMWTERVALFNLRIDARGASRLSLDLTVRMPRRSPEERVALSIDCQNWVEAVARDDLPVTISGTCKISSPAQIVSVIVLARDAKASDSAGETDGTRLIGVGLIKLSVTAIDEQI